MRDFRGKGFHDRHFGDVPARHVGRRAAEYSAAGGGICTVLGRKRKVREKDATGQFDVNSKQNYPQGEIAKNRLFLGSIHSITETLSH